LQRSRLERQGKKVARGTAALEPFGY